MNIVKIRVNEILFYLTKIDVIHIWLDSLKQ